MTEAVLKVWESYFKGVTETGNDNELELSKYVEGKVEVVDVTHTELHGMKMESIQYL